LVLKNNTNYDGISRELELGTFITEVILFSFSTLDIAFHLMRECRSLKKREITDLILITVSLGLLVLEILLYHVNDRTTRPLTVQIFNMVIIGIRIYNRVKVFADVARSKWSDLDHSAKHASLFGILHKSCNVLLSEWRLAVAATILVIVFSAQGPVMARIVGAAILDLEPVMKMSLHKWWIWSQ